MTEYVSLGEPDQTKVGALVQLLAETMQGAQDSIDYSNLDALVAVNLLHEIVTETVVSHAHSEQQGKMLLLAAHHTFKKWVIDQLEARDMADAVKLL